MQQLPKEQAALISPDWFRLPRLRFTLFPKHDFQMALTQTPCATVRDKSEHQQIHQNNVKEIIFKGCNLTQSSRKKAAFSLHYFARHFFELPYWEQLRC